MAQKKQVGRNDRCSCGSGKKFKHCCGAKPHGFDRQSKVLLLVVGGLVAGAIILGIASVLRNEAGSGPRQVWSAEHGHYHTVD